MFGWVLGVMGGVGGMFVVGLVSGRLVGGWWEGALVSTLSVQDLVRDGCRRVAVKGGSVG